MLLLAALPSADKVYMALAGVGIAVFALVLDMIKSGVQEWREKRKKAKQSSPIYLAEKQVQLDLATDRICSTTHADHVGLFRLHNGEYFEDNDSIKKMSMVSEATKGYGQSRWKATSQSMLMSNFPHLVLALYGPAKQALYRMTPASVLDFEMGRLLNEREYVATVALLIRGQKDKPLAILLLSWSVSPPELADLNVERLEEHRRDLSFTLSD